MSVWCNNLKIFFFDEQSLWLMCNQNLNVTCSSLRCITYLHNVSEETTEPINQKQYIFVHVPF